VLQTYKRQPIAFVKGAGAWLYDDTGREYLDLVSGIGVDLARSRASGLAAAIADQASTLLHTSNLYFHPFQAEAAARLTALSGLARAFFCNSGTEANEACLKFARRYWHTQGATSGRGFVAVKGGSPAARWGAVGDVGRALPPSVHAAARPVTFSIRRPGLGGCRVNDSTAAVIAEPIRGEGGVHPLSPEFAQAIAEACRRTGTLLIADEVQSGLGRTGYASIPRPSGWTPDLISVGKALGSGVPVGAALSRSECAGAISRRRSRQHYGGNLLATARRRSSSSS
jgi:acetylornithine/succinyldiaminopimelate/putrescine aminotransferase